MNPGNLTGSCKAIRALLCGFLVVSAAFAARAQTADSASTPLIYPTSIAFDAQGVLYVAETGRHVIDRLDTTGVSTMAAGSGTQGFAGDGGPASAAQLDSPRGLTIDAAGNLYIADTRNHRIRMVTAATGIIHTIAGTGSPGYSGDGGVATSARLSLPTALTLDQGGNLYVADSGNHRIRRLVLATGVITTVAGNGVQGYAGDAGPAVAAALDTPWGLATNAEGDLYLADLHNGRVRRVAQDTGLISTLAAGVGLHLPRGLSVDTGGNVYVAETGGQRIVRVGADGTVGVVAGTGAEGFYGDGGLAAAALLDGPQATALSPAGLVTLADTRNQRVRQVDGAGIIRTIGGAGASAGSSLSLTGPATVQYGTGTLIATLTSSSPATGVISFVETVNGTNTPLGNGTLASNAATFSTAGLRAGTHQIVANYAGDTTHPAAVSNPLPSVVTPAPVIAHPVATAVLYGQALPLLTGSLSGVLARDANSVSAIFASNARLLSPVGSYPIAASLVGSVAANYEVVVDPAVLTITQAPTTTMVGISSSPAAFGAAVTLSARAASTTQGTPTGRLTFLDGPATLGSTAADTAGSGSIATTTLGIGTHTLSAVYSGDGNFLASSSSPVSEVIQAGATPDFTLAAAGSNSQTVPAGSTASFAFTLSVQNGPLNSPILLSASGTPSGATATFSPAYVTPGGAGATVTLSIQTAKTVAQRRLLPFQWGAFALLLILPMAARNRKSKLGSIMMCSFLALSLIGLEGCGEKVTQLASPNSPPVASYPMIVTATSTLVGGSTLQHTASVTLIVQ